MRSSPFSLRRWLPVLLTSACVAFARAWQAQSASIELKPADPYFSRFNPKMAPAPGALLLKAGDRLAIVGDSITEQKMYSRIMETYLTVCVPELSVTVRQFGWSGETAEGFLRRMTNDCLRFKPTVATTCYGMNDHRYQPYDPAVAQWYQANQTAIIAAFKEAGTRVVLGSPGCVGKLPSWIQAASGTVEDLNLNLCALRNLDLDLAAQQNVRFADMFWPMLTAGFTAQQKYATNYAIAGTDGVHPGWAGHLVMAYAFLKAMGLDGDLGTFTVDLGTDKATATAGHVVDSFANGTLTITSRRYPYCARGPVDKDSSIRSAMTLVPFNAELNRLKLVVKGGAAANYSVTWGDETRTYSAAQLTAGVNLADDFELNPFSNAFAKVDTAVTAKQTYETRQVKTLFHGEEGRADIEATAALTEKARQPLADGIAKAFVPVTHTVKLEAR